MEVISKTIDREHIHFSPAVAGAALPADAFAFLQCAALFFSHHELAPFAPAWLAPMAQSLATQGRDRILTEAGADQMNARLGEVRACFSDVWVIEIMRRRSL